MNFTIPEFYEACERLNREVPDLGKLAIIDKLCEKFHCGKNKVYRSLMKVKEIDTNFAFAKITGRARKSGYKKVCLINYNLTLVEKDELFQRRRAILDTYDLLAKLVRESKEHFLNGKEFYLNDLALKRLYFFETKLNNNKKKAGAAFEIEENYLAKELWTVACYPTQPLFKRFKRELEELIDSIEHHFPKSKLLIDLNDDLKLVDNGVNEPIARLVWKDITKANQLFN